MSLDPAKLEYVHVEAVDLRRRDLRDLSELIVNRSQLLQPTDRELLRAVYEKGVAVAHVARIRSESPRKLRARVRRLVTHITSPRFNWAISNINRWDGRRRQVLKHCWVEGRSLRGCVTFTHMTLHEARREATILKAIESAERTKSRHG